MDNDNETTTTTNKQNNTAWQVNEVNVKEYPSEIELAIMLKGVNYPAAKDTIVNSVLSDNTDKNISELLGQIEDKVYNNTPEVINAIGLVNRE